MEELKTYLLERYKENKKNSENPKVTPERLSTLYAQYLELMNLAKHFFQWDRLDIEREIEAIERLEALRVEEEEKASWTCLTLEKAIERVNLIVNERDKKRTLSNDISSLIDELLEESKSHAELMNAIEDNRVEVYCPSEYYIPTLRIRAAS